MYNDSGEHSTKTIVAVGGVDSCEGVSPDLQGVPPLYSEFAVWGGGTCPTTGVPPLPPKDPWQPTTPVHG